MFRKSFPTFFYYLALASVIVCPCEEYLGIVKLALTEIEYSTEKKLNRKQCEFFLGNGIEIEDKVKAANDLLIRDHPKILQLLKEYCPGKLGAYFVPPMFFGSHPDVLDFEQYSKKTKVNF